MSFEEQERIYNGQSNPLPAVPADAVSVALAYKKILEPLQHLARGEGLGPGKTRISESSLAFGPKTIPADGREKQVESDIPEERLSTVDRPIVELKPQALAALSQTASGSGGSCDDEAALAEQEALERERLEQEEAECCNNRGGSTYISYR